MEDKSKQVEKQLKDLDKKPFNEKIKESIKIKQEYVNKPINK